MYTCDLTNPIPSTWSIPHLPSECLTLCGRGGQGLYEDGGEYGVNMAFIGPKPLLQTCLGATHSSQASPAKEAVRTPPLRLSSSSCVVIDSLHLFFWSKRADISHVRSEGVCGVAQQTLPHSGWGRCLLPPHSGWGAPHCHFGTICSSVPSWLCFSW